MSGTERMTMKPHDTRPAHAGWAPGGYNPLYEPLRERIARVLYEEGGVRSDWHRLTEKRRAPWLDDADRVITAIKPEETPNG